MDDRRRFWGRCIFAGGPSFSSLVSLPLKMNSADAITTRIVEIETTLRRERLRLQQALEANGAGVWEWYPDTDELWWSKQMFALYAINPEVFGCRYADFENAVVPEDVGRLRTATNEAVTSGKGFYHIFTLKNGRRILSVGNMDREAGVMRGINLDATVEAYGHSLSILSRKK